MLAAALVARVEELAAQLEQSRAGSSNTSATTTTSFSCPAKKAAQMLGVSIASLQRLEKGRELPELRRAGGTHGPTSAPRHPLVSKEE